MKSKILNLIIGFVFPIIINAQTVAPISSLEDPGRGLYVSNFFKIITPSPTPSSVNIDPSSVLGNAGNTTALLEYCRDNHITP